MFEKKKTFDVLDSEETKPKTVEFFDSEEQRDKHFTKMEDRIKKGMESAREKFGG